MEAIFEFIKHLIDPDWIMANGGLYLVAFIIFAETGLFIGFFLPGDSLLFITGMIIATATDNPVPFDNHLMNLVFWVVVLTLAAVIGNIVGYWFGKKAGPMLFQKKDTWLFKQKHLHQAHDFYEKKGGFAIVLARFLPIVRTFAPIVAGIVKMDYKKFVFYNILGAVLWVVVITTLGFMLGENAWVREHLEWIILALVVVTTGPVLFKMFFGKHEPKPASLAEEEEVPLEN